MLPAVEKSKGMPKANGCFATWSKRLPTRLGMALPFWRRRRFPLSQRQPSGSDRRELAPGIGASTPPGLVNQSHAKAKLGWIGSSPRAYAFWARRMPREFSRRLPCQLKRAQRVCIGLGLICSVMMSADQRHLIPFCAAITKACKAASVCALGAPDPRHWKRPPASRRQRYAPKKKAIQN